MHGPFSLRPVLRNEPGKHLRQAGYQQRRDLVTKSPDFILDHGLLSKEGTGFLETKADLWGEWPMSTTAAELDFLRANPIIASRSRSSRP